MHDKAIREKELDAYREAYVFFSSDMGKSIAADADGKGNPDVCVGVKYKQHVRSYPYPCAEDGVFEMLVSLNATLVDGDAAWRTG